LTVFVPYYDGLLTDVEGRLMRRVVPHRTLDDLDHVLTRIEGEGRLADEARRVRTDEDSVPTLRRVRKSESGLGVFVVTTDPSFSFDPEVHHLVL